MATFKHVFDGTLSISEMQKERRPYHKQCSCGLHNLSDGPPVVCLGHVRIAYVKRVSGNRASLSVKGLLDGKENHVFNKSSMPVNFG